MKKPKYKMKTKVWLYPDMIHRAAKNKDQPGGRHFANVNKKVAKEIKQNFGGFGRGFGSIPITATIGKTSWQTSIFPDKKSGTYLLPIKASVRKKENIKAGKMVAYAIEIRI